MPFAYPDSVRQQVIAMGEQGLPPAEIEKRLTVKVPRGTIYQYLHHARREGRPIGNFKTGQSAGGGQIFFRLVLPLDLSAKVTAAATARGMLPRALLTEIIECVFDGPTILNAVLDD